MVIHASTDNDKCCYLLVNTRVKPKVSGLAAWNENCNWYSSLPLRNFVSRSSGFYRHNPLCCFSANVYCCKRIFRYRLSPETFGYSLLLIFLSVLRGMAASTAICSSASSNIDVHFRYNWIMCRGMWLVKKAGTHAPNLTKDTWRPDSERDGILRMQKPILSWSLGNEKPNSHSKLIRIYPSQIHATFYILRVDARGYNARLG
jgi:hypothetical protein